ncbi:hypothetical protein EDD11_010301 [Mortierella claussenii]|nr:hypothetical protein EDD11_010301 [Mortierella claussenii]
MATQFVNVASLVPNQHHCNLKLRVLSVETIAETVHPTTGKVIQSAEAIVGDDTACILLNLKNDQVNLLANNARLQVLNARVNMYRGFMRLEVDEDEDADDKQVDDADDHHSNSNNSSNDNAADTEGNRGRPSITTLADDDEEFLSILDDNNPMVTTNSRTNIGGVMDVDAIPRSFLTQQQQQQSTLGSSDGANDRAIVTTMATAPALMSTARITSGSSLNPLVSNSSLLSLSSAQSRDQLEVEMRLGTGGSVPLVEYYRTIEFTYFSTVEPVGR